MSSSPRIIVFASYLIILSSYLISYYIMLYNIIRRCHQHQPSIDPKTDHTSGRPRPFKMAPKMNNAISRKSKKVTSHMRGG